MVLLILFGIPISCFLLSFGIVLAVNVSCGRILSNENRYLQSQQAQYARKERFPPAERIYVDTNPV